MNGPKIMFEIPIFGGIPVTETVTNTWIIMAFIVLLSIWLTHDMKKVPSGKQVIAEKLVGMLYNMVEKNMGKGYVNFFAPYIGALFTLSALGSLSSLLGMRPLTADFSTTLGWALLSFMMIQGNNIRCNGIKGWLKGFIEPVPLLLPINIIGEIANPISMSFRHFGNIAAGMVITSLLYGALASLSAVVLQWIPNTFINSIPIFQLGLPAILSIYFDLFTSFLQAYIICMLTMVFVANAGSEEAARGE
ncbi:MAG: F0F1 ATP synthase subunit A [Clostridia bacterium]|nr:F0F1 ATP synthase subunit A [Clostridia bacterium]